jgi:hypothetical protein
MAFRLGDRFAESSINPLCVLDARQDVPAADDPAVIA